MSTTVTTPTPAPSTTPAAGTPATASGTKFDFFINILIGTKTLALTGKQIGGAVSDLKNALQNGFSVSYHADSFDTAFSLGTIGEAADALNSLMTATLGGDPIDIGQKVKDALGGTVLDKVVNFVTNDVELRITDLAFSFDKPSGKKTYTIGVGLDFGSSLTLDTPPLGLRSFGFTITNS